MSNLYLCEDGHDQIAYTSERCPCCRVLVELSNLQQTVGALETQADELRQEMRDVQADVRKVEIALAADALIKLPYIVNHHGNC